MRNPMITKDGILPRDLGFLNMMENKEGLRTGVHGDRIRSEGADLPSQGI